MSLGIVLIQHHAKLARVANKAHPVGWGGKHSSSGVNALEVAEAMAKAAAARPLWWQAPHSVVPGSVR